MKKITSILTLVGILTILIGGAFTESESMALPVSIITIGLFITVVSTIVNNRIQGEER